MGVYVPRAVLAFKADCRLVTLNPGLPAIRAIRILIVTLEIMSHGEINCVYSDGTIAYFLFSAFAACTSRPATLAWIVLRACRRSAR